MTRPVHYELELSHCLSQPLCENQRGVDAITCRKPVEMTTDERFVSCRKCLDALGYDAEAAQNAFYSPSSAPSSVVVPFDRMRVDTGKKGGSIAA